MPDSLRQQYGLHGNQALSTTPCELESATRQAKQRLHAWRKQPEVKAEKAAIVARHGSRQRLPGKSAQRRQSASQQQLGLELE
jgi:deoxyribodipyrimidine photo-lyase